MKTYLSLSRLKPYFKNTNINFITLFGVYFLTGDINKTRQFYANHYLCESLDIEKLPKFRELLQVLESIGKKETQISFNSYGHITVNKNVSKDIVRFEIKKGLQIDFKSFPNIEIGQKIMNEMIDKVEKHHFNDLIKKDKFNIQNYKIGDLDSLKENGYVVVKDFLKKEMLSKVSKVLSEIAKRERETENAYIYGKEGRNQRIYNLLSKHIIFRDILESTWLEHFLDSYYQRPTFHEKYALSSMAAHIIPPDGEDMPLHLDNAVPDPIPKNWPIRLVVVIPLCDFTKENGTTYVVPGSNKLLKKPNNEDAKNYKGVHVEAKAGSLLIWDGNLWHKSTKNMSDKERNAIIISYGASFFKEICGEEEHLVVVPDKVKNKLSPRIKSLIGMGRGIKKGAIYIPDYE